MKGCNWYFASHGCDLPDGHEGDHRCLKWDDDHDGPTGETCFEWPRGAEFEFQGAGWDAP